MVVCCACRGDYQPEHQTKKLTPQASYHIYLLILLWGKWLWLRGTYSNLKGTCKHKQMVCCAVLSWCKRCTVMLLKLQWSIWRFPSSFNYCHQHQCHLQHHWGTFARCYVMMRISGMMHMTVRPDSQRVSSKRCPIGQVFPGFATSHFIHAQHSNIRTTVASPPHFDHEKEQYQCAA